MEVSDRIADLRKYFPFSSNETVFRTKALSLGKCVKYETGEPVLFGGSPAKHCGLILDGQAVAFKTDSSGRRYQLCLEEGCFVGLETVGEDGVYTAKVSALTDLEVLFWNADGLSQLFEMSPDFEKAMRMLNEGRIYQEQWLVPETDITDPVLGSVRAHWLSVAAPALLLLPFLLIGLGVCGLLIRHYLAAWLLVFLMLGAAGSVLYRSITARANERLIITSRNLIHIPRNSEADMRVIRLSGLQSVSVRQNFFERMLNTGRIVTTDEKEQFVSPLIGSPQQIAELVHDHAVRRASGRPIPLNEKPSGAGRNTVPESQNPAAAETSAPEGEAFPGTAVLPPFHRVEFRPHWGMLAKLMFMPLLVVFTAVYAMYYFRFSPHVFTIRRILLAVAVAAAACAVYQFFVWRNHRFVIEEDCVKDYSKRPFSKEDLNMVMNHKIESVRFEKQGFFQVLLNYGTVYILAGEGELSFNYVGDPQRIQQLIMDTCARYDQKLRMEEEARRRAYISSLVSEIHRETNPSGGQA